MRIGELSPSAASSATSQAQVVDSDLQHFIKKIAGIRAIRVRSFGEAQLQLPDEVPLRALAVTDVREAKFAAGEEGEAMGLLDSGAPHAVRAESERDEGQPFTMVRVELAANKIEIMKMGHLGTVLGHPGTQPIVPMTP